MLWSRLESWSRLERPCLEKLVRSRLDKLARREKPLRPQSLLRLQSSLRHCCNFGPCDAIAQVVPLVREVGDPGRSVHLRTQPAHLAKRWTRRREPVPRFWIEC